MRWLKILATIIVVFGIIVGIGTYLGVLKVTPNGVEIIRDEDLVGEPLFNRANLYFRLFQYKYALQLYCRAVFNEDPSFCKPMETYKPEPGQVDLAHIYESYDLDEKAKKMPQIIPALFNIGVCYAREGKPKEAMMVFKAFCRLFPNDPLIPMVERNMEALRLKY